MKLMRAGGAVAAAILVLATAGQALAAGVRIDPDGRYAAGDSGSAIDPDGRQAASSDRDWGIDPNGRSVGIDPNGREAAQGEWPWQLGGRLAVLLRSWFGWS